MQRRGNRQGFRAHFAAYARMFAMLDAFRYRLFTAGTRKLEAYATI